MLVEFGQPQVSAPTLGLTDKLVAFVIALETALAQLVPAYGLLDAYCAPASTAWLTRICCEKARPISIWRQHGEKDRRGEPELDGGHAAAVARERTDPGADPDEARPQRSGWPAGWRAVI